MRLLRAVLLAAVVVVAAVYADVYLHNPPGSNNRLDGQDRERKNANRLFDSQNNDRGGYNVGGRGEREGEGTLTYIGGSFMSIQWTDQHECGGKNTGCDIILQYMCSETLRDGTSTRTISENGRDLRKGMHEDAAYYQACKNRARDTNLYTADQNVQRNDARGTRQNPKGTRRGLECPEERDYYPYHAPSPWRDVAILTNNVDRCDIYKQQSQNVIPKGFCTGANRNGRLNPITKDACTDKGGTWSEAPAHGIPAPQCLPAPKSRDNHNGNTEPTANSEDKIPRTLAYNWTVPDIDEEACTLRIRYNISIGDYEPFGVDASHNNRGNNRQQSDKTNLGAEYGLDKDEAKSRGYYIENNPKIKPMNDVRGLEFQLALNTAQTGRVFQDRTHKFRITKRQNVETLTSAAPIHNLNVIGKRGNIVQVYPAVEYGFEPAILKVNQGDYVMPQWTGSLRNPNNNDGEGRNGEDKNNIITMTPRTYKAKQAPASTLGHSANSYPLKITTPQSTFLGVDKTMARKLAFPTDEGNVDVGAVAFSEIGCYRDKRNRAISGGYTEYAEAEVIQRCAKLARKLGNQVFAVQYKKQCFTSPNAQNTYATYGRRSGCRNGRGGSWRMNVYQMTGTRKDEKVKSTSEASAVSNSKDGYYSKALDDITESLKKTEEKIEEILDEVEDEKEREAELSDAAHANDTMTDISYDDDVEESDDDDDDEEVFGERVKRRRQNGEADKLDYAPATVSVGVIRADTCGTFNYLCTRNNNFSNRSQKGKVVVCS